ncbi:GTPase Der [Trichinella spiralis]|uniref:GTPase Der n=1 Tax=Trichinella spiralis TaxID=6334 RepID=A0ABR3KF04_TRISP
MVTQAMVKWFEKVQCNIWSLLAAVAKCLLMAEISFIRHAACPVFYLFNSMFSCIETGSVRRTEQNIYVSAGLKEK